MSAAPAPTVRPRRLAHRGRVEAAALYLDAQLLGESAARRRVLALWTRQSTVFKLPHGYLIRWPRARSTRVDEALGLPLVARLGRLVAAPLTRRELDGLTTAPGDLVLVRDGRCCVVPTGALRPVDPADWLDPGPLDALDVRSLGHPSLGLTKAESAPISAREVLTGVPRPAQPHPLWSDDRAARRAARALTDDPSTRPVALRSTGGRVVRWLRRLLDLDPATRATPGESGRAARSVRSRRVRTRLVPTSAATERRSWIARLLGRGRPARPALGPPPLDLPAPEPHEAVWRRRLRQWLLRSPLGRYIASQQERYLAQLLGLLRDGQLDEALRYAVPLEPPKAPVALESALGVPRPRDNLSYGDPRPPGRHSALQVTGGLTDELEAHYRRAFRRFEREGAIDRAAFVLFELLGSDELGIELLERHGRFAQAARIAEGRGLSPSLVVRLYMAAGDTAAAIRVARRTGAFADAVHHLSLRDATKAHAHALRRIWALHLAEAGDLTAALRVVFPHRERYPDLPIAEWAARAAAAGGVVGAQGLAQLLEIEPDSLAERWPQLRALLDADGTGADEVRWALARALLPASPNRAVRGAARATARALLARADGRLSWRDWEVLEGVVKASGDVALRVDLPRLAAVAPPARPVQQEVRLAGDEVGRHELFDAALLPDGRLLVALGESGVRLLGADGHTIHQFAQPAHALVVSDAGSRALAVAWRDRERRIAHLDLESRRARRWGQLALTAFAPTYDGARWLAADGDDLVLLDVLADEPTSVWRAREVGVVLRLARSPQTWAAVVRTLPASGRGTTEVWRYESAGPTLRERLDLESALPAPADPALTARVIGAVSSLGWLVVGRYHFAPAVAPPEQPVNPELLVVGGPDVEPRPMPATLRPEGGVATSGFFVQGFVPRASGTDVDYVVWVSPWHSTTRYLAITAEARPDQPAEVRALRASGNRVLVADSTGRLLVYDVETGELITRLTI